VFVLLEVYRSSGVPIMTEINDMPGKCAGDQQTLAFMMTTTDNSRDVMTICPSGWTAWGDRYISQYAAKSLSDMLDQSLDKIGDTSPELTLLHELTHAESFFGDQVMGAFFLFSTRILPLAVARLTG
jgi:hypothetical protein